MRLPLRRLHPGHVFQEEQLRLQDERRLDHRLVEEVPVVLLGPVAEERSSSSGSRPRRSPGTAASRPARRGASRPPAVRSVAMRQGPDVLHDHPLVRHAGVIEPVGPGGHLVHLDRGQRLESGPAESLAGAAAPGEQVDDGRSLRRHGAGRLGRPVIPAQVAQLALLAERLRALADGPPVLDEVDVQRVAQVGRDQLRELALELLVVESLQRQAQLAVRADPGQHAPDMRVGREDPAAERVHHHAVGALPLDLGQLAEERFQLLVRPVAGRLQRAGAEGLAQLAERAVEADDLLARQAARDRRASRPRRAGRRAARPRSETARFSASKACWYAPSRVLRARRM